MALWQHPGSQVGEDSSMTRRRPRFNLPPRGLTDGESGGYLGLGPTEFHRVLPRLEAEGLPKPDPLTGRRDSVRGLGGSPRHTPEV